jgi:hypothetical protein
MRISGKKHILFALIFVAGFVAYGEEVKTQVAKADSLINDDVLVDDLDKDVLNASKSATEEPAKKDSAKSSSPVKIKGSDDVLILDGGAEDLLGTTKSVKPTDSVSKPLQQVVAPKTQGTVQSSDSVGTKTTANGSIPIPVKVVAQTIPTKIEATNSINFARNLKDYRSPKIAMLLSFLLPGAGEIYARNGYRAAAFGIVEVGVIATGVAYAVKGKNQIDEAHKFADQNYSVDQFKTYYNNLAKNFPSIVDSIFSSYYYDVDPSEFSKKTSDYYDLIGDQVGPFVQGWKDVEPQFDENFLMRIQDSLYRQVEKDTSADAIDSSYLVYKTSDSSALAYGFSKDQEIYNSKIAKGNKSYKISKNIFTMLLINHIVSAIDAGICAKAYNDKLLGKQTFWQKINLKDIAVNSGSGTASGYALEVRF